MHVNTEKSDKQVAIIGGGIAGLSLAYYLQKQGLKVAVFDREEANKASMCSQGL